MNGNRMFLLMLFPLAMALSVPSRADHFGTKITLVSPGDESSVYIKTENPIYRTNSCNYFNMGKYTSTDKDLLNRVYSSLLAAYAAKLYVTIWYSPNTPCQIDEVWVQDP